MENKLSEKEGVSKKEVILTIILAIITAIVNISSNIQDNKTMTCDASTVSYTGSPKYLDLCKDFIANT